MADWFKFYENDLDETRLQYAISKLPEVVSVWVGILSEACRHKSGTISWGTDEIELFGFSRRLGISVPKVNEAVNLLCEIRYISKSEGLINILKWREKQSEYCQWKEKKKDKKQVEKPRVSRECPESVLLEERRIEENIIPPITPQPNNPTNGHSLQKGPIQLRAEKLFSRRETTPLTEPEKRAFKKSKNAMEATTEDDWILLEKFYSLPQQQTYSRKDLATLVNNWNGEIDRAKEFFRRRQESGVAPTGGHIPDATWDSRTPEQKIQTEFFKK